MEDTSTITVQMRRLAAVMAVGMLAVVLGPDTARAQFENRWLAVGSLHNVYTSAGGEWEVYGGGQTSGEAWPGLYPYSRTMVWNALWIGAKDVEAADTDQTYDRRVVHIGPRNNGLGEFFVQDFRTVSRFANPNVTVDGLETFNRPVVANEVESDIEPDRMLVGTTSNLLGIETERRIMQFSQEDHDNYHIIELTFTNTGNVDEDPEPELNQTLEDVRFFFSKRRVITENGGTFIPGNGWGANVMNDVVGDGMEDYDTDFRAELAWLGNSQNADIDPLGGPVRDTGGQFQEADTVGRLGAPHFVGTVTIHADEHAHQPDETAPDDPDQPSMTGFVDNDATITTANSAFDEPKMLREYRFMEEGWDCEFCESEDGHMYPHHADIVDRDGDFTTGEGDPQLGYAGGIGSVWSYGPYTLEPGESVRIVMATAAAGLSREAATEIGRRFKANDWDPEAPIEYDANKNGVIDDDEVMGKNDWWYTGRDSLYQTFERAIANWESGLNIPSPPRPPREFHVESGVGEISLTWETFDDENPPGGFEIYRSSDYYQGDVRNNFQYELVAELDSDARSYRDTDVSRGINYFYYIQSVGEVNEDNTGMTPTGTRLKSSRYWTQTYDPAVLRRGPGEETADVRVVPNPLNLSSDEEVRWSGVENQIGFLDVPGQATITIYTELGERIATIEHTDGSGDEYWDLQTESAQPVVSGIYVAVIEDHDTGEQVVRRFVIIR